MHKYIILLSLLSLSLGITFAVLKAQNDKDIKLNPNTPNYSTVYTWLSIISFILFLSTLFAIYILNKNNYRTPNNSPSRRPILSYYTPDDSISDDTTPQGMKISSDINRDLEKLRKSKPFN